MADHVTPWLEAYHDGELRGARLRQVEHHLAGCVECQAELDKTRGLSALLHDTTPVGDFLPTERFVANLTLNLPRQSGQTQPRTWLEIGWWLIPVGLLGALLFVQITFSLSSVASLVTNFDLLGGSHLAWLQGNPPQTEWFTSTMDLFGSRIGAPGRVVLSALNRVDVFVTQAVKPYIWQALLAVLYLVWLLSWWFRYQRQPSQNTASFSQSNS